MRHEPFETAKTSRTGNRDRGVSPVIGVILMVAITVILAAVIGGFVLGIGPNTEPAPNANLALADPTSENVTVAHEGGNSVDLDDFSLVIDGAQSGSIEGVGALSAGESRTIEAENVTESIDFEDAEEISIRHDPSGTVMATTTGE